MDKDRQIKTDRKTDRNTDRKTGRRTGRKKDRKTDIYNIQIIYSLSLFAKKVIIINILLTFI